MNSTLTPIAPTEAQVKFINDLLAQLEEVASADAVEQLRQSYREMYSTRALTKSRASEEITRLLDLVRIGREHAKKMGQRRPVIGSKEAAQVPAGRYAITAEDGHTIFVRVMKYEDGDGFQVNQQIGDDENRMPRVIARIALQKIIDDGIEAASARYGQELGVCGVCGKTLTNEDSRQLGIGPVCRAKLAG